MTLSSDSAVVAYLGPAGTYTHQASLQHFSSKDTLTPLVTIPDCIESVVDGSCDYAVVPFENSTNGSVVFTLDSLRDRYHSGSKADLGITGEEFVSINHCLITEATDLSQIKKVYSHPQVWGQCDRWYDIHLKGVRRMTSTSTSKAVEQVKGDPESAAIASRAASMLHQVPILVPDIANDQGNTTRFLILSKIKAGKRLDQEYKTLLSFTVEHSTPGSLVKALEVFAKQGMNMTWIESRPRPAGEEPWTYVYFVELKGHESDKEFQAAVSDLQHYCLQVAVWGSFQSNRPSKPTAVALPKEEPHEETNKRLKLDVQ